MKKIILCADDYGQNEAISQAIISLIKKNHLSATSCMTTSPSWPLHAKWLLPYKNSIDIGLHFNLTEGKPLSHELGQAHGFLPLPKLLMRAFWQKLDPIAIEAELHAQLDCFIATMGQLPHFIDGHQHVHQFPLIRHVLFKVYEQRLQNQGCYIRCIYDPQLFVSVKKLILQMTGARVVKKELITRHIPCNPSFAGVYDFDKSAGYAKIFPQFLAKVTSGGLIMCHPGMLSLDQSDTIAAARYNEYRYLESDSFVQDCFANRVILGRFKSTNI